MSKRLEAFYSSEPRSPLLEDGLITMALGSSPCPSLLTWKEMGVDSRVFSLLVAFLIPIHGGWGELALAPNWRGSSAVRKGLSVVSVSRNVVAHSHLGRPGTGSGARL